MPSIAPPKTHANTIKLTVIKLILCPFRLRAFAVWQPYPVRKRTAVAQRAPVACQHPLAARMSLRHSSLVTYPRKCGANFHETTNRASEDRWQRSSFRRHARRGAPNVPATEPRMRQQERSAQTPRKSIQERRPPRTPTVPSPFRSSSRERNRAALPKRSSCSTKVWRRRSPTRPTEETRTTMRQRCRWLQQQSARKDYPRATPAGE